MLNNIDNLVLILGIAQVCMLLHSILFQRFQDVGLEWFKGVSYLELRFKHVQPRLVSFGGLVLVCHSP